MLMLNGPKIIKFGQFKVVIYSLLSCLVLFCLTVCLVVFAYFSYMLLWRAEESIFRDNFKSTANELSDKIVSVANRVVQDGSLLATIQGTFYPNIDDWPNAYIQGFSPIASQLDSSLPPYGGVYMMPIVYPDRVQSFEAYAAEAYAQDPDMPENAGVRGFGFGIYATNTSTRLEYHDVSGFSVYNSSNKFLTPVLAKVDYYDDSHMWNPHNDYPLAGISMDDVYACVKEGNKNCQTLSPSDNSGGVAGVLAVTPIHPRNEPTAVVGFVVTAFVWKIVLKGSVAQLAADMNLVVSSSDGGPTSTFTCSFHNDMAVLKEAGDKHDRRFSHMGQAASFSLQDTAVASSTTYNLVLYPTYAFYTRYHTNLPLIATLLSSLSIAVTVVLFVVYDRFVKSDSELQAQLLEGKRRFVRFISHEIRTPLNTAMIGLQLIEEQLIEQQMIEDAKDAACPPSPAHRSPPPNPSCCDSIMELVGEVRHGTEVALDVLNDLLQYDKIEIGKLKLEIDEVDLWRVVQDNIKMFTAQALKKGVTVQVTNSLTDTTLSPSRREELQSLRLRGDSIRIAQAVRNIISNALKFSPQGGSIAVTVRWTENGLPSASIPVLDEGCATRGSPAVRCGSLLFEVRDEGPGMSHQELHELFGEGVQFQANKLQAGAGSGLGLYITKSIVEMHGGRVWAASAGPGCGSIFSLELPLCEAGQVQVDSDLEAAHGMRTRSIITEEATYSLLHKDTAVDHPEDNGHRDTPKGRAINAQVELMSVVPSGTVPSSPPQMDGELARLYSKQVLVVDDAPTNRKMLCRLLTRWGYTCKTAEDGLECLSILEVDDFGIIVMDFQMPKVRMTHELCSV